MSAKPLLVVLAIIAAFGTVVAAAQSAELVTIAAFAAGGIVSAALATVVP